MGSAVRDGLRDSALSSYCLPTKLESNFHEAVISRYLSTNRGHRTGHLDVISLPITLTTIIGKQHTLALGTVMQTLWTLSTIHRGNLEHP